VTEWVKVAVRSRCRGIEKASFHTVSSVLLDGLERMIRMMKSETEDN
jgi:hypothetical protein